MRGDHVYVRRRGYTHHGVEVDGGEVVHFTGTPGNKRGAMIRRTTMAEFTGPRGKLCYRRYGQQLPADLAVERAESKIGQSGYSLFSNNCEHFATWCVHDRTKSSQVSGAKAAGAVVSSTAAGAAAGIGVISGVGAAAGLSGPGIMSGLATVGGTVGAGAVGGLAVLGAAPGAAAVAVMNIALRDDPTLSEGDRVARRAGRASSAVGAVGGTAVGVGAVSVAGVSGLSAAGITSGLAAIGATVGGGMAAGSAIVIAGPAIAAAGLGYGVYRAARRLRRDDDGVRRPDEAPNRADADLAGGDLSIPPIDTIEFRDVVAASGRVVKSSAAVSDPS
jgi:lecithin:retinol acyltransferase